MTEDQVGGVLARISRGKRDEVRELRSRRRALERAAGSAPPPRPVLEPLRSGAAVGVFAEVKRRSPGAGKIDSGLDPVALSGEYEAGGAAAVSVLTDGPWFGGSLEDLAAVRAARGVPVLRKDFLLDPLQVLEARAAGADMVLVIMRLMLREAAAELVAEARGLGMTALVEVHDRWEVEGALAAGARLIGINNRNLRDFSTDLSVTEEVAPLVPAEVAVVAESGIRDAADVSRLAAAGADAVLVGEALVRSSDPRGMVAEMASVPRVPGART